MSESVEVVEQEAAPDQPKALRSTASVGHVLAAAREAARMTVEEAATQLRLGVRQIQALENDDATALPGPAFVRGFLRNYAKLLGLNSEELLAAHRVSSPGDAECNISLNYENIPIVNPNTKAWMPYLLASAVVALALAGWMIYMEYGVQEAPKVPVAKSVAEAAVAPAGPVAVTPEPVAVAPMDVSTATEADPGTEARAPAPSLVPAPVGGAKLTLNFAEQSWVSVNDRAGKEIFNKTQAAGSQSVVEGVPPFSIVIGNAKGVQLTYNDKPVDLALHAKANVARLTLE